MISTLLIKFSLDILLFILVCLHICMQHYISWMMWGTIDYTLKTLIYYYNLWAIVPSNILWVMS